MNNKQLVSKIISLLDPVKTSKKNSKISTYLIKNDTDVICIKAKNLGDGNYKVLKIETSI